MYSFESHVWNDGKRKKLLKRTGSEVNTLCGDQLRDFLSLCLAEATYFTFRRETFDLCDSGLEDALGKYLIGKTRRKLWFGYDLRREPEGSERSLDIYIYDAAPETLDIFLHFFSDIFLRKKVDGVWRETMSTLTDLCFFSGNDLFVGTVSHAYILDVYTTSKSLAKSIRKLGRWKHISDRKCVPPFDMSVIEDSSDHT